LLKRALKLHGMRAHKATNLVGLALAALQQGRRKNARRLLKEAKDMDADRELLPRGQREHGTYLPLVLDLVANELHWLDVQSPGMPVFDNVGSSKTAIAKLCPELIDYFGSGARPSMLELAMLYAAARCRRVFIREGQNHAEFMRGATETASQFFDRLARGAADEPRSRAPSDAAARLAFLLQGDVELTPGSSSSALFRERVIPPLAASDLLS
jgi:hypothetical protein